MGAKKAVNQQGLKVLDRYAETDMRRPIWASYPPKIKEKGKLDGFYSQGNAQDSKPDDAL